VTEQNPANDQYFMQLALAQARLAALAGEVPVGAVVVSDGVPIVSVHNRTYGDLDPSAHAEVLALRRAAQLQQSPRLTGCTLYVTLEPCSMCIGAMVHARIERLVYGAKEPRSGAVESAIELAAQPLHNHHFEITAGIEAESSAQLMKSFFAERRHQQQAQKAAGKGMN